MMKLNRLVIPMFTLILVALLVNFWVHPRTVKGEVFDDFTPSFAGEALYFKVDMVPELYAVYLMDKEIPSGLGAEDSGHCRFASLPLAEEFVFEDVVVVLYHQSPPTTGIYYLYVTVGWFDSEGVDHDYQNKWVRVPDGVNSTSLSFDDLHLNLLPNQRLMVKAQFEPDLYLFWGAATNQSQVSYSGIANYVLEFPSLLILPLFMIATLLALILYKRSNQIMNYKLTF